MMDLILEFNAVRICGDGSDGIGSFAIQGYYDDKSMECSWVKAYIGRHSVEYNGYREGKGIWGTWNLIGGTGGFHIWPIGSGPSLDSVEEEEEQTITREASHFHLIALKPAKAHS